MSIQSLSVVNDYPIKCGSLQLISNPTVDYVLTSDAVGNATWQAVPASTTNIQPLDATITVTQASPSEVKIGATGNFTGHVISTDTGCSISGGLNTDTLTTSTTVNMAGTVDINRNGSLPTGINQLGYSGTLTVGNPSSTMNVKAGKFGMAQATGNFAFVNPVTVLTLNGTSGIINLTGFSLGAGATAVIQVTNSSVTANSVVMAVINESALTHTGMILAVAGLVGGFSINISNYTNSLTGGGVTITGTCGINFMLC